MSFLLPDTSVIVLSKRNCQTGGWTWCLMSYVPTYMFIPLTRLQYPDKSFYVSVSSTSPCPTGQWPYVHSQTTATVRQSFTTMPGIPAFWLQNRTGHFSYILGLKTYINPKYHFLDIDGLLILLMPTMTVWWSDNPSELVGVYILLRFERFITRQRKWPCIFVEKVMCCLKSKDARIWSNSVVDEEDLSILRLK